MRTYAAAGAVNAAAINKRRLAAAGAVNAAAINKRRANYNAT